MNWLRKVHIEAERESKWNSMKFGKYRHDKTKA